jgi:hypothetical protein
MPLRRQGVQAAVGIQPACSLCRVPWNSCHPRAPQHCNLLLPAGRFKQDQAVNQQLLQRMEHVMDLWPTHRGRSRKRHQELRSVSLLAMR